MTALDQAVETMVADAIDRALARQPRFAVTQREAASILALDYQRIGKLVGEGKLERIDGPRGPISVASMARFAGWPIDAPALRLVDEVAS